MEADVSGDFVGVGSYPCDLGDRLFKIAGIGHVRDVLMGCTCQQLSIACLETWLERVDGFANVL